MNSKSILLCALAFVSNFASAFPGGQPSTKPRNITREIEVARELARQRLEKINERLQQQQQQQQSNPIEREIQRKLADRMNRTLNDLALRTRLPEDRYNKLVRDLANGKFVPRNLSDVKQEAGKFCAVLNGYNSSFAVAGSTNGLLSFRIGWTNADNAGELTTGDIKRRCFSKGKRFTFRVAVMAIYESNAISKRIKLHEFKDKWTGFVRNETTVDNSSAVIFSNSLTPGGTWNNLKITFSIVTAADVAVMDDGSVAQPNRLKWGFKIENWPYSSASNSVKVLMGVFSKLPRSVDANNRNVSIGSFGEFSWDATAKINTVDTAIETSSTSSLGDAETLRVPDSDENDITEESMNVVELTFPANAAVIDYDPELNADEAALSSASTADISGDQSEDQPSSAERVPSSSFAIFASLLFSALMVNW